MGGWKGVVVGMFVSVWVCVCVCVSHRKRACDTQKEEKTGRNWKNLERNGRDFSVDSGQQGATNGAKGLTNHVTTLRLIGIVVACQNWRVTQSADRRGRGQEGRGGEFPATNQMTCTGAPYWRPGRCQSRDVTDFIDFIFVFFFSSFFFCRVKVRRWLVVVSRQRVHCGPNLDLYSVSYANELVCK